MALRRRPTVQHVDQLRSALPEVQLLSKRDATISVHVMSPRQMTVPKTVSSTVWPDKEHVILHPFLNSMRVNKSRQTTPSGVEYLRTSHSLP